MAYCQQSPWIFNGTLRTNIIGESPIDQQWLREVVYACALDVGRIGLPLGLDTVTGSSGAQLSGGLKQRVVSIPVTSFYLAANLFGLGLG
jgi:ABC-type transport system involved in cytochrome bd biosynthesis fused ATPase/permease subunit